MIYFPITTDILNVSIETYARNISIYITSYAISKMTSVFGVFKFRDFGWKCTQNVQVYVGGFASDRLKVIYRFYEIIT